MRGCLGGLDAKTNLLASGFCLFVNASYMIENQKENPQVCDYDYDDNRGG